MKILFRWIMFCMILSCVLTAGCSSLIRQTPQAKKSSPSATEKKLSAEDIAAMTPEQLKQYHEEKQKKQEKLAAEQQKQQLKQQLEDRQRGEALVDSFMKDRPSREKRDRLGNISRQLNYRESAIFPWREGRRSEGLLKR